MSSKVNEYSICDTRHKHCLLSTNRKDVHWFGMASNPTPNAYFVRLRNILNLFCHAERIIFVYSSWRQWKQRSLCCDLRAVCATVSPEKWAHAQIGYRTHWMSRWNGHRLRNSIIYLFIHRSVSSLCKAPCDNYKGQHRRYAENKLIHKIKK